MPSISEPGYFCTNGMSLSKRDSPFANSGLVVTLDPSEFGSAHPLGGMELQRHYERLAYVLGAEQYACPIQRAADFLAERLAPLTPPRIRAGTGALPSSYPRETIPAEVARLVPPAIARAIRQALPAIDRRWRGAFVPQATLVGPEARGSAPVRIPRNQTTREAEGIEGLYPVGEGAGYAGGIISAAVDGLRSAKAIVARYAPLEPR
jgi:uncharacterized FAD-dependent dehydrogenase